MSSTYTPSLRLTLQGDGDNSNTWGDITNTEVIELIEAGICGVAQVNCTGSSDVNIASTTENGAPDTARNMVLQLVGTIGADIQLIVPAVAKVYLIDAQFLGGYTITMKCVGGSTTVDLVYGDKFVVYTTGTTIVQVTESASTGALLAANNLDDLTNAATARTNLGLGTMAVQNANNVNITGGSITGVSGLGTVTSVAGRTGAVTLSTSDISGLGALALLNSVTGTTGGVTATANKWVMGAVTAQWGTTANTSNPSVTFPTAFSGAPTAIVLTTNPSTSNISYSANISGTPTSTGFSTHTWSTVTGNTIAAVVNWLAIGPT